MGREISDVFKAKTRLGKRKVLDKFDISKEDKNKFLNGIKSNSGESGGESSSIEYLDLRGYDVMNNDSKWSIFRLYSISCIVTMNNTYKACLPSGMLPQLMTAPNSNFNVLACAIDFNIKTNVFMGELQTINEYFTQALGSMGFTQEELNAIPRLTKEQFYSLE